MFRILQLTLGGGLLLTAALTAAATEVARVEFEQSGVQRLSEDLLTANIQLRPGLEFTRDILDADTKRLYNTGNFADVVSEVTELPGDKVAVRFRVRLKPRISTLRVTGNAKLTTNDLRKLVTVAEGGLLNDIELRKTLDAIRKEYLEKGYRDAKVTPVVVPDGEGQVIVDIRIEENLRLKVDDVTFEGAEVFSQRDLRHSIANRYSYLNWLPFINDYLNQGLFDRAELELDKARLRDKYHDAGYLDFKVEEVAIAPDPEDPEYVNLNFRIVEGEPYKVASVAVKGNTVYSGEELAPLLPFVAGSVFSRAAAEAAARRIVSLYETLGYADVQCRVNRVENFADHTVAVTFEITEGRKYYVRGVDISGNTDTRDKVIRRELAIQPGDPLDRNRIEVSRQRLMGMGYFNKVEIDAVNADAMDEKDVKVRVEEKGSRYNFRIGAGASDVNSVFGMAEISSSNFDLFNPSNWFYGGGQRLRIQGIYGIENAGFNVDFVEPWLFDLPLRFELAGYMNIVEYDEWDETRVGGRTSLQRKIFDDFTSIAAGYKFEVVRVNNVGGALKKYMRENNLDGTQNVSQVSLMLSRDTRDSLIEPTEGYNLNFFAAVSPKIFGSTENFYRLEGKGSYYMSFFDKAIIAMVGGKIGTVATFSRGGAVPIFERYFLGGSDSLRGFEYRTVSPTYNDENIGGQTMLLMTAEVSHPIWGPIRGAAFIDVGNAWRNSYTLAFNQINIGAGYGLRIRLPVINAPVKLDLAYPILNNTDNSSKFRIHFNVGFTF